MATKAKNAEKLLEYKGKPLVRSGNTIYYGDLADPYIAVLQCVDTVDFSDMKLPSKVMVQILSTNEELGLKERIKKRTDKPSLYEAINIASIWLERILEEE
jgi:protein associated with RNAse G/E